jgi:hypothetical protein
VGILNKLWSKVWNDEEAKKRAEADQVLNAAHIQAAEIRARKTPVQEMADKHGGAEDSYYNQQYQYHLAQLAHMKQQSAPPNPLAGSIGTGLQSGLYSGSGISGSYIPSPSQAIPSTHIYQSGGTIGWPTLGSGARDIFFLALKGIEEAAMGAKNRADNYRYDDHALAIQDMRYFDPQKISLLGLLSFCLSNLMEVEPLVVLLEGHGMVIIDE